MRSHCWSIRSLFGLLFLGSLMLCLSLGQVVSLAQNVNPSQIVQQGVKLYEQGDYQGAIALWQQVLTNYQQKNNLINAAIVEENLARASKQVGQINQEIDYWEQTISSYQQLGNLQQVGRMLTEQAQAYMSLGQHQQAIDLLCGLSTEKSTCQPETALQIARQQGDRQGEAAALGSLGEAYRLAGKYDLAINYLETAKNLDYLSYQSSNLIALGNAHFSRAQLWNLRANSARNIGNNKAFSFEQQAKDDYLKATEYFKTVLTQNNLFSQMDSRNDANIRSLLNLIKLYYRSQDFQIIASEEVEQYIQQALTLSNTLPNSTSKIYELIDLATLPRFWGDVSFPLTQCPLREQIIDPEAKILLDRAVELSQNLADSRAESFAQGTLGHYYECLGNTQQALLITQKAILAADQKLTARDSLYLWEWQMGRIFQSQGENLQAIAAFDRSLTILDKIRSDILTAERDIQFDFRDVIEPLYRQLARLRLESISSVPTENRNNQLTFALETIDALRLAELQNYFGNDCILTDLEQVSAKETDIYNQNSLYNLIPPKTALFSSILLNDRLAILLSLPNGNKELSWIRESSEVVIQEIQNFRQGLRRRRDVVYDSTEAQNLYNWIIQPFAEYLKTQKIETLVFIQDGLLRTIPMAALHDGEEFLVEKYAIATIPSLRLTKQKSVNWTQTQALILGLSQDAEVDGQVFAALTNVPEEIKEVEAKFTEPTVLLNEKFTSQNLQQAINKKNYPIIHIASHAQFGTIAEDTFIVTGDGSSRKLTLNELETTLRQFRNNRQSLEILALTACETALGDERAALGLAGVALQAGARSAIASLWAVNDESTSILITEFYNSLVNSGVSRASALRVAQQKLIKAKEIEEINDRYAHPYYWAGFILIGEWGVGDLSYERWGTAFE